LTYKRNFPIFALSESEFKKTDLIEAINQLIGYGRKDLSNCLLDFAAWLD